MPEIVLPTKGTQDFIKNSIEKLLAERLVKSIQRGEATFPSDQNTLTVNISGVSVNKALLVFSNTAGGASSAGAPAGIVKGTLTNSTTLTFKLNVGTTNNPAQVSWQLVEFY